MGCMEKSKTSNISGTMPAFFSIFHHVLENDWLSNKNYWDDLDSIN